MDLLIISNGLMSYVLDYYWSNGILFMRIYILLWSHSLVLVQHAYGESSRRITRLAIGDIVEAFVQGLADLYGTWHINSVIIVFIISACKWYIPLCPPSHRHWWPLSWTPSCPVYRPRWIFPLWSSCTWSNTIYAVREINMYFNIRNTLLLYCVHLKINTITFSGNALILTISVAAAIIALFASSMLMPICLAHSAWMALSSFITTWITKSRNIRKDHTN